MIASPDIDTPALDPHAHLALVEALVEQGWYVGKGVIDPALCQALHREIHQLAELDALDEAGIGRGQQHHLRKDIRGDAIHWLDRESDAQRRYLDAMASLQQRRFQRSASAAPWQRHGSPMAAP